MRKLRVMYTYMLMSITLASISNDKNRRHSALAGCWRLRRTCVISLLAACWSRVFSSVVSQEKRLSQHDMASMSAQRQALLDRLADFEATNRTLRAMLRERHEEEAACLRLAEQRDLLLKKLTETEARVEVHVHTLCWTQVCVVMR